MKNCIAILIRSLLIALLLFGTVSSCTEFVDVPMPDSQLTAQGAFEESATAHATMTSIYAKMRDTGLLTGSSQGLSCLLGTYTDEMLYFGSLQGAPSAFYNNTLLASNTSAATLWNSSYNQIYAANAVLEGVSRSAGLSQADKDQLTGEALFVRAFLHFYLAQLYDGVPYIKTTDYIANAAAQRLSVAQVMAAAKADIEQAIGLLGEDYATPSRVRPNRYAAYAVLAKICLHNGEWDEAGDAASAVLNATQLYQEETIQDTFLSGSKATVWQFSPSSGDGNTQEGETFIFASGPPPGVSLRNELVSAFSDADLRKAHWIKAVTNGTDTWYHAYKYKQNASGSSTEHSIVLRLAELYLIRAESRARAGELIGAKEDLDRIRTTAGLPNTAAVGSEALLEAILKERQLELFTELGHRYFDLRRFGRINDVLSPIKPDWQATDAVFPIPETELDLNRNLAPQNQGY